MWNKSFSLSIWYFLEPLTSTASQHHFAKCDVRVCGQDTLKQRPHLGHIIISDRNWRPVLHFVVHKKKMVTFHDDRRTLFTIILAIPCLHAILFGPEKLNPLLRSRRIFRSAFSENVIAKKRRRDGSTLRGWASLWIRFLDQILQ